MKVVDKDRNLVRPRLQDRIALNCSSPSLAFFKPTLLENEDFKDTGRMEKCFVFEM